MCKTPLASSDLGAMHGEQQQRSPWIEADWIDVTTQHSYILSSTNTLPLSSLPILC